MGGARRAPCAVTVGDATLPFSHGCQPEAPETFLSGSSYGASVVISGFEMTPGERVSPRTGNKPLPTTPEFLLMWWFWKDPG